MLVSILRIAILNRRWFQNIIVLELTIQPRAFALFMAVFSVFPLTFTSHTSDAEGFTDSFFVSKLQVTNWAHEESNEFEPSGKMFFSIGISNNDNISYPYIVIFDIRDSNDYSVKFDIVAGEIGKYSHISVEHQWASGNLGRYNIRAFVISDTESPEILSPIFSRDFQIEAPIIESTPEPQKQTVLPVKAEGDNTEPKPSLDELKEYALRLINEDRKKIGIGPVQLSGNKAAQMHAEDVLQTRLISHWMSNGEKPYMTYTRMGGTGYVSQNIGINGDTEYYDDCLSGKMACEKTDVLNDIEKTEYGFVYQDGDSDWGHRDNILDEYHTHVSIGIAYDDYFFVLVQNFENNYIVKAYENDSSPIIIYDHPEIRINGKITTAQLSPLANHANTITIYYDPLPTAIEYEKHKYENSYGNGDYVGCVLQEQTTMYCPDAITETAIVWQYFDSVEYDSFLISASLHRILDQKGVYTIVLTAEPVGAKEYDESWPVASYSIWHD